MLMHGQALDSQSVDKVVARLHTVRRECCLGRECKTVRRECYLVTV